MRGRDQQQAALFSYRTLEERIPQDHPLRPIRQITDPILRSRSPDLEALYARTGRRSIPPERLLRAVLLEIFSSVRSERLLVEQLEYNLRFRWFVGLEMDEEVWNHAVFSKNRERLLNQEVAREFFRRVLEEAQRYLSDEHFTVDGTLIEAWASQKSFRRKEGGDEPGQFRGERRSNQTHESKRDPEARLYRKGLGQEARVAYLGHLLLENRSGLIVDAMVTQADGTAERDAALLMVHEQWRRGRWRRATVGADKGYDCADFVHTLKAMGVRAHVAPRRAGSAMDADTVRQADYQVSQRKRCLIEKAFAWMKQIGGMRKTRFRGLARVAWQFLMTAAAFNLWRLPKLQAQGA